MDIIPDQTTCMHAGGIIMLSSTSDHHSRDTHTHSLVVVLSDLLCDETRFMLVVDGKTSVHVDLVNECWQTPISSMLDKIIPPTTLAPEHL